MLNIPSTDIKLSFAATPKRKLQFAPTLQKNHLKSGYHTTQGSPDLHKAVRQAHANGLLQVQHHIKITMPKL